MIHPEPTTKIDPTLARGTLVEVRDATETAQAAVVLSFPNTSYQIELETSDDLALLRSHLGEMVMGHIFARALRVDCPYAGGRRVEPCIGAPRRVMGTVVGIDPIANVLVVDAGMPMALTLTARGQEAKTFAEIEFIACDVLPGARFSIAHG